MVVWYRIRDPYKSVVEVSSPAATIAQTSLTGLRTVMGQHSLDKLLKEQDKLATMLKETIDKVTEPWGIQVEPVEIKDVEIPQSMQRAMAQEAKALREKRAPDQGRGRARRLAQAGRSGPADARRESSGLCNASCSRRDTNRRSANDAAALLREKMRSIPISRNFSG